MGNCADLKEDGQVKVNKREIIDFMKEYDFSHYMETSSKTGNNVENLFSSLTKHLYLVFDNVRVITDENMLEGVSPIQRGHLTASVNS